ncbi:uncharacterized protein ANIA_11412 [Aspergillus nidulans FGSC A4]|uniref:Uncharacterized protein n=1 Tax=Emericella nidulans (strain FGSC A4 / ATCC 38163 / CBS 112.46 / NRRL 194 / M139) TaxID=227321 RepID=C8V7B9_EMENI|nr:hypothetical protein [Aspergillus nidulans FGSC A4]CBF75514.1 TPA: hypothetical protein ANIA_11412 [Aspergillus nidulans FGSC A4]
MSVPSGLGPMAIWLRLRPQFREWLGQPGRRVAQTA